MRNPNRKISRLAISLTALIAMTAEASAEAVCDKGASAALKTAAVQQELMVAGFACGASASYNRFVLSFQPELQKSDAELMTYFQDRDGSEAGYDSYKTKVANLASSRSSADTGRYCAATARGFANATASGQTLKDFVAGQHLLFAAPEACAVKFDSPDDAVAGPGIALPASPYGAPDSAAPPAARRPQADPDRRQAYNDVPPPPPPRYGQGPYQGAYQNPYRGAYQSPYQNSGYGAYGYGPYGGAAPRWWYGNAYDD